MNGIASICIILSFLFFILWLLFCLKKTLHGRSFKDVISGRNLPKRPVSSGKYFGRISLCIFIVGMFFGFFHQSKPGTIYENARESLKNRQYTSSLSFLNQLKNNKDYSKKADSLKNVVIKMQRIDYTNNAKSLLDKNLFFKAESLLTLIPSPKGEIADSLLIFAKNQLQLLDIAQKIETALGLSQFPISKSKELSFLPTLRLMNVKNAVSIDVPVMYYWLKKEPLIVDEFTEYFPSYKALEDEFAKKEMSPKILGQLNELVSKYEKEGKLILPLDNIYISKYDFNKNVFRVGRKTAIPREIKFEDKTSTILKKLAKYNDVQSKATMNLYSAYGKGVKGFFKALGNSIAVFYCELIITNANTYSKELIVSEEDAKNLVNGFDVYMEPYEESESISGIDENPRSINAYVVLSPSRAISYRTTIGALQKSVECKADAVIYYTPKEKRVISVEIH